ncbi:MAG: potassium channel family protein [Desulfuromonadaceae bacterium]
MTATKEKLRLKIYLIIFIAVMLLGTFGFMAVEGMSLVNAAYFTIVTIATVGYGDLAPATGLGKLLDVILIVTGVGTFLGVIASATDLFLSRRENSARRQKLHMVIGLFFSETGGTLLQRFTRTDPALSETGQHLLVRDNWTERDFHQLGKQLPALKFNVDPASLDLIQLRGFLTEKGNFIVRLLENPSLLEHESFTDLLIATLHLKEELEHRADFSNLPETDLQHLAGDVDRVYGLLARQWVDYMQHLKGHYPFLFSLAMRTNPFDRQASVIVQQAG